MSPRRCLYCYEALVDATGDYHPACSRAFFGFDPPPSIPYSLSELHKLGNQMVESKKTLTGAQPKLSLEPERSPQGSRLTFVGLWGTYILKPSTQTYPELAENEHLTMNMAQMFGIRTAKHALGRLKEGEIVYLTKRFDRTAKKKAIHQEDFCQILERLTEDKYKSSLELVANALLRYSQQPVLDGLYFWQVVVFCFLTGNADMHLKNFSLQYLPDGKRLSPAYDLVNTRLALPEDREESALTLNGKRNQFALSDFVTLAQRLRLEKHVWEKAIARFSTRIPDAIEMIGNSFLSKEKREAYTSILLERAKRLHLVP